LPRLKGLRQLSVVGAILQDYRNLSIPQVLRLASEDAEFQVAVHSLVRELGIGEAGAAKRIVMTSPGDGDGKTVTVFALAEHLAAAGRRVLVVECDPVTPAFAQVLLLPACLGLRGVLSDQIGVANAVVRTDHPDLDVLPFGEGSAQAAERLFGTNLAQLLSGLDGYDAILIDSPLPAQQSNFLAGMDRVVLCVRSDRSLIEPAVSAVSRAKALGASSLAIVVTMVDPAARVLDQSPLTAAAYARAG
jgi:Mrp family chromosome partitioning ATPase